MPQYSLCVNGPDFSHLADLHQLGDLAIPDVVREVPSDGELELVWRIDLGGLTSRCDRFVKWNPRSTGIDLDGESVRLEWISARHPAPLVLDSGSDGSAQWLS